MTMSLTPAEGRTIRTAGSLLLVSSVVGAASLVFLVAMFASFATGDRSSGLVYGALNDVLGPAAVLLAVPAMFVLHRLVGPASPRLMAAALVLGLASVAGITVLQALLVTGRLTFEQEVGPVMVMYLGLAAWFVIAGRVGANSGLLPRGTALGVGASLYVGYPVWAIATGRRLRGLAEGTVSVGVAPASATR